MPKATESATIFHLERWHPLTDLPGPRPMAAAKQQAKPAGPTTPASGTEKQSHNHPLLTGVSPDLVRLLYDILVYLYVGVRVRIQRLNMSVRSFEKAKLEGCEKGFILESTAGATTCLIPLPKTFDLLGFQCPYKRDVSHEHSYYVGWGVDLLQQDPATKKVHTELNLGESNCTSDIVTVAHDGVRRAYEVTLSVGNCLSNAVKYAHTDFAQIVFLCRDYKLRQAAKACCREGGLGASLWAKLEFIQFSTLARRQHKTSP